MRAAKASRAAEIVTLRGGHWGLSGISGLGTEAGGRVVMVLMVFMMMVVMVLVMMSLPCDNLPLY